MIQDIIDLKATDTIYISGSITNNENYEEQFRQAELKIRSVNQNVRIINPIDVGNSFYNEEKPDYNMIAINTGAKLQTGNPKKDWVLLMAYCLESLATRANAIYMLNNWERSDGAKIEHALAVGAGYKIIYE